LLVRVPLGGEKKRVGRHSDDPGKLHSRWAQKRKRNMPERKREKAEFIGEGEARDGNVWVCETRTLEREKQRGVDESGITLKKEGRAVGTGTKIVVWGNFGPTKKKGKSNRGKWVTMQREGSKKKESSWGGEREVKEEKSEKKNMYEKKN